MSDRRIVLAVLLIIVLLAIGLGVALAWHSFQSSQATKATIGTQALRNAIADAGTTQSQRRT